MKMKKTRESKNIFQNKLWLGATVGVIALALISACLFYIFRGTCIKDLSNGTLLETFKTRDSNLQKALVKIHSEGGLPNQITAFKPLPDEDDFAVSLEHFYKAERFQKLKKACSEWQSEWDEIFQTVSYSRIAGEQIIRKKTDVMENSPKLRQAFKEYGNFNNSFKKAMQAPDSFFKLRIDGLAIVPDDADLEKKIWNIAYINYLYFLSCAVSGKDREAAEALDNSYAFLHKIMGSGIALSICKKDCIVMSPLKKLLEERKLSKNQKKLFAEVMKKWNSAVFPQANIFMLTRAEALLTYEFVRKRGIKEFLKQYHNPGHLDFPSLNPDDFEFDDLLAYLNGKLDAFAYKPDKDEICALSDYEKIISEPEYPYYKYRAAAVDFPVYEICANYISFSLLNFSSFKVALQHYYMEFSGNAPNKKKINPLEGKAF